MTTQAETGTARKIAYMTSLTEQSTSDLEGIGTVREDQYGQRYRWIQNGGTAAAVVGAPECFDETDVADSSFLGIGVGSAVASGDKKYFAGIWLAAVAASSYGWILSRGVYETARIALASGGAIVAGDLLTPGAATATTGTNSSKAYSFNVQFIQGITIVTGAGDVDALHDPHAIAMGAVTAGSDDATATVPSTAAVFVKGLL